MSTEIFTTIYTSMLESFGLPWISWLFLFAAFLFLITVLLEVDILIGLLVTSLPLIVFSIYNVISLGGYGLAIIVLLLGLGLATSLQRLFVK